jgi:hypothetical protein
MSILKVGGTCYIDSQEVIDITRKVPNHKIPDLVELRRLVIRQLIYLPYNCPLLLMTRL